VRAKVGLPCSGSVRAPNVAKGARPLAGENARVCTVRAVRAVRVVNYARIGSRSKVVPQSPLTTKMGKALVAISSCRAP